MPLQNRAPAPGAAYWSVTGKSLWSLERVYAMLRNHYSGQPLDAVIRRSPPDIVLYEVQWLTQEGRKIIFFVDAHDGQIKAARGLEADANSGR